MSSNTEQLKIISSVEDLRKLSNTLKTCDLNSTYMHYYILNLYNWRKILSQNDFPFNKIQIYVPNKNENEFNIFIIIDKTEKFESVTVWLYSKFEGNNELLEYLRHSIDFNWKQQKILFAAVHEMNLDIIKKFLEEKQLNTISTEACGGYILEKEKAINMKYSLPKHLTIAELDITDTNLLLNDWKFRKTGTSDSIKLLIKYNKGICILNKDNEKIGWILMNEHLAAGMLRVVDTELRKGYAKYLVSSFSKTFAETFDLHPITFIVRGNHPSVALFLSLRYKLVGYNHWIVTSLESQSNL